MTQSPPPTASCSRRDFLGNSARQAAGVAVGVFGLGASASAADVINVGIIGLGPQGRELAGILAGMPGTRIAAICDVDAGALAVAQEELAISGSRPIAVTAHESLCERKDVDAVVIAAPEHWQARLAVDACRAGKDIYLEQPVAHSVAEGEILSRVAADAGVIVQTGLPQRSGAHFQSAVELLRRGEIGRIHLAKAWAVHRRRSIGRSAPSPPPAGVDYERWLGPAPEREFQANRFHQHWPWFWDFGSGELGQWGVQLLDVVRWGMNLDLPTRIAATGSNNAFRDDRETPDTMTVQFEFPGIDVVWEHRQWSNRGIEGRTAAAAFYGERGTLVVDRSGWKVYDGREGLYADSSEIRAPHLRNWLNAIRTRTVPTAPLEIGRKSMAMCHLGNIAWRLGREIRFDPVTMSCGNDEPANGLLAAGGREPWRLTEG